MLIFPHAAPAGCAHSSRFPCAGAPLTILKQNSKLCATFLSYNDFEKTVPPAGKICYAYDRQKPTPG